VSVTPQQQFDAVKAAVDAALQAAPGSPAADRLAYDYDNVPPTRPLAYVPITVSRRYVAGFRVGGPNGLRGGRLTTGYVAKHVDDARELQRRTRLALEDVPLLSGAVGPFRFESEQPIAADEDWWFGLDSWTFANPA
jgi:hypothetical protein